MRVDAGALHAHNRFDAPKPLDGNVVPGAQVDVLIDAEHDGYTIRTTRGLMQPQRGSCVCDAAIEPAAKSMSFISPLIRYHTMWFTLLGCAHQYLHSARSVKYLGKSRVVGYLRKV